jgi:hypothetical protein
MSVIKRFVAASLATLNLSALHAEPRCPGNVAGSSLRGLEKISSRFKFGINHTGPYDFLVDRSRPLTVPLPQVFI